MDLRALTAGGGGWSVHESCLQAGQVRAGHTEGPKAPGAAGRGKGPVSSSGAPAGWGAAGVRAQGRVSLSLCLSHSRRRNRGREGRGTGGGWGGTTSLPFRGLKNSPLGPERPRRGGATSRLLVTGAGTGSGAGGQAAAPASRGRGRRPAGSARRWSRRAGWGQPVTAPVAVAPRCLYEAMAGGPCWTPPSPARPRRFAAPAGPVPARRGHQDGSALPSFTCDTPRQLSAASAAALPASAERGMPGGPGKEPAGPGTGRDGTGFGRACRRQTPSGALAGAGTKQRLVWCALVVLKCGGCPGTQRG
ncbi:uncharacterized protein LOC141729474 [Zonotrichia albicollis]|uniref:uncharacterized protein LOC141729474 n=1 Tax=Zonotrichia albicollis TaxID=44394 RepID=UPI003D80B32A